MALTSRRTFLTAVVASSASIALADVNLVTIPSRDDVQLTIYNSEDLTMVREQRLLTLKQGLNHLQFSWTNTLIDPTSLDFRILDHEAEIELLETTFPAGRTDALQWNIRSDVAGKVPVEIRYFTSGITWAADYVGIANQDESKLRLTGYVRVTNDSGELYDGAETRMVVGNINLVERIADLANRPVAQAKKDGGYREYDDLDRTKMREEFGDSLKKAEDMTRRWSDEFRFGNRGDVSGLERTQGVVKQGLSEYFLFAIEGRNELRIGEPQRLVSLEARDIPLETLYKLTDRDGGQQFSKFYRFANKKLLDEQGKDKVLPAMQNLGLSPLPDGNVRLFSEYANNDLAYVGGTATKYVPIGDRVEVNVGLDPDIVIHRRLKDQQIANVVVRQYKRRESVDFVRLFDLTDYDETFYFEEELISGKSRPVKTEIERKFEDNVVLWGNGEPPVDWQRDVPGAYVDLHKLPGKVERVDTNHVKYFVDLAPGEKQILRYSVTYKRRKVGPELNVQRKRERE